MKYNLLNIKEKLLVNIFWFPLILTWAMVLWAFLCLRIDETTNASQAWYHLESMKLVLSQLSTALVTAISIVFSITILILSMAANLLGPRLIPNFLRKGPTQLVLGIFLGSFLFCIVVLSSLNSDGNIPNFAITWAMGFSFISFILLIYFIHFVCQSIQVEFVLKDIMATLKQLIQREFHAGESTKETNKIEIKEYLKGLNNCAIKNNQPGYVQSIDYDALFKYAQKNNLSIQVMKKVGDYVTCDYPIVQIHAQDTCEAAKHEKILKYLQLGDTRQNLQDVEFSFEQIAEIALRALSPSINNPYTAMVCINYLAEGLVYLSDFSMRKAVMKDDEGEIRIMRYVTDYEGVISKAFNRLRQQAKTDLSVNIKLLQSFCDMLEMDKAKNIHQDLIKQAELIYQDSQQQTLNGYDQAALDDNYHKIEKLATQAAPIMS